MERRIRRASIAFAAGIIVALAASAYSVAQWQANLQARAVVADIAQTLAPYLTLQYRTLKAGVFSPTLTLSSVTVTPKTLVGVPIAIDRLTVSDTHERTGEITSLRIRASEAIVPVQWEKLSLSERQFFETFHIRYLVNDLTLAYQYRPKMNELTFTLDQTVRKLGQFHLKGIVGGVKGGLAESFKRGAWVLKRAEMRYRDDSLVAKLQQVLAKQYGLTKNQYVAQLVDTIAQNGKSLKDKKARDAMEHLAHFLQKPTTLSIIVAPPKPIPLAQLSHLSPDSINRTLGVQMMG